MLTASWRRLQSMRTSCSLRTPNNAPSTKRLVRNPATAGGASLVPSGPAACRLSREAQPNRNCQWCMPWRLQAQAQAAAQDERATRGPARLSKKPMFSDHAGRSDLRVERLPHQTFVFTADGTILRRLTFRSTIPGRGTSRQGSAEEQKATVHVFLNISASVLLRSLEEISL